MRITHPVNPGRLNAVELPWHPKLLDLTRSTPRSSIALTDSAAAPTGADMNMATVKVSQFSLQVAAQLGYGSLVNFGANVTVDFYLLEFLAFAAEVPIDEHDLIAIKASGARFAIATTRAEGKVEGNVAAIAASASMNRTQSKVSGDVWGVPKGDIQKNFYAAWGNPGSFDLDAVKRIGTALGNLAKDMVDVAKTNPGSIIPDTLYVAEQRPTRYSAFVVAASNGYALHRITQDDSFSAAMSHLSQNAGSSTYPFDNVDPVSVQVVYDRIVGSTTADPSLQPGEKQKNFAESIQNTGN